MNRERRGKKQKSAPKEIEVFDGDGEKIVTIMFCEESIVLKNHNGKKIETIAKSSEDGFVPQIFDCKYGVYASVGEPWKYPIFGE